MPDISPEVFRSNPDAAINYMMAMYEAANKNRKQNLVDNTLGGSRLVKAENSVRDSKNWKNSSTARTTQRSSLSSIKVTVSETDSKLLGNEGQLTLNSSTITAGNRSESVEKKRKRESDFFPLDLSVKKQRRRSDESGSDAQAQPALNSKTIPKQPASTPQLSNHEQLVVTDCAETKPSDHVFTKFKLDKLHLNSNNKHTIFQGKFKNLLANQHKQSRETKSAINSFPMRNKPVGEQHFRSRDSPTTSIYEKKSNSISRDNTPNTGKNSPEMRNGQFLRFRGSSKNDAGPKDSINGKKDLSQVREKELAAAIRSFYSKMQSDGVAKPTPQNLVNSSKTSPTTSDIDLMNRLRLLEASYNRTAHNAGNVKNSTANKQLEMINQAIEQLLLLRYAPRVVPKPTPESSPVPPVSPSILADLGDWNVIETGHYPAFGKGLQSKPTTPLQKRLQKSNGLIYDESYLSENTLQILRNATFANLKSPESASAEVHSLSTTDLIHRCYGCSSCRSHVPKVIEEIWKFKKTNRYTTPSKTTSSNVTYCWQLQPKATPKCRTSSMSSANSDVTNAKDNSIATSTVEKNFTGKEPFINGYRLNKSMEKCAKVETACKSDRHAEERKSYDDDLLANLIEYSSDEEEDQPITNGHVSDTRLKLKSSLQSKRKLQHFKKEVLENIEENNSVGREPTIPKLLSVCSLETEKDDVHLSDLEISDDEDEQSC